MSKTRSISSLAAGLGILALACWFVTATFPLAAEPQMVADGSGVTVDTGGAVMHRTGISYPSAAHAKGIQGVVTLEATIDSSGNVVDTRVLSGPNELRRAAQQSLLSWHFATDTASTTRTVKVNFEMGAASAEPKREIVVSSTQPMDAAARAALESRLEALSKANGQPVTANLGPQSWVGRRLANIAIGGLSDAQRNDLLSRLPVHEGDTLAADWFDRVRATAREFDEHLSVSTSINSNGEVNLGLSTPGSYSTFPAPNSQGRGVLGGIVSSVPSGQAPPPPPPPSADGNKRIAIGSNVQQAKLISQTPAVYPALAKQAHVQGVVHLQAVIAKDGTVADLHVIAGHPLLVNAAMEAVRQWVYQPTLLNGEPVDVLTQVDVNFTLADEPSAQ